MPTQKKSTKDTPYTDNECNLIITLVLKNFVRPINTFAKTELPEEMRQDFIGLVGERVLKQVRDGIPPYNECYVNAQIDWEKYERRIRPLLNKAMNWSRADLFRKHHSRETNQEALVKDPTNPTDDIYEFDNEFRKKFENILDAFVANNIMSKQSAECLLLRNFDDLTFVEIGVELNVSKSTAKRNYDAALEVLRNSEYTREVLRDGVHVT